MFASFCDDDDDVDDKRYSKQKSGQFKSKINEYNLKPITSKQHRELSFFPRMTKDSKLQV